MKRLVLLTIALVFLFSGMAYALPLDSLVAYYAFTGNADDASGHGHHGSVHGATLAEDRFGNPSTAYSFDGLDDYIVSENFGLRVGTDDSLTISAWVYVNSELSYDGFHCVVSGMSENDGWDGASQFIIQDDNSLKFRTEIDYNNGVYWETASGTINYDEWMHVAMVWNGGQLEDSVRLFINATEDSVLFHCENPLPRDVYIDNIYIGKRYDTTPLHKRMAFHGNIDDVYVFNCALTETEIEKLYTAPNPVPEPATVLLIGSGLVAFVGFRVKMRHKS